jgi:hypothetical protein
VRGKWGLRTSAGLGGATPTWNLLWNAMMTPQDYALAFLGLMAASGALAVLLLKFLQRR